MNRLTLRSSTVLMSAGNRIRIFKSLDEMPPNLRKKLEETTTGMNSATILIADRKGREELVRAIQGHPSSVKFRVTSQRARKQLLARIPSPGMDFLMSWRTWIEIGAVGITGLAVWLFFLPR